MYTTNAFSFGKASDEVLKSSLKHIQHGGGLWQFARFVAVGLVNTGFSYLVYAIGLLVGLHFAFANLVAMVTGILFSFKSQGHIVFFNTEPRLLLRFALSWFLIWTLNVGGIYLLVDKLGLNAYVAGALCLGPVVVLSFFIQKYFVFARR